MIPKPGFPACVVVALLGLAVAGPDARQRTYLNDVLDRAALYVLEFEKEGSAVVAEEHYTQHLKWGCRKPDGGAIGESRPTPRKAPTGARHRELISDVLMVQLPDQTWIGFRDVAVVDGRPVRDRAERLESLFLESPATLRKIQKESARYNIGNVLPEFNLPTFALAYLHPGVRDRFEFRRTGDEVLDGTRTVVVAFTEVQRPTVVKDGHGGNVPSAGEFWIDPSTGAVLKSRLVAGDQASDARVESLVLYRRHEDWRLLLPDEMNEVFDQPSIPDGPCVAGAARYSNFRRFQVSVDEKTTIPTGPQILSMRPPDGDMAVDPGTSLLELRFDRPMREAVSFHGDVPRFTARPSWNADRTVLTVPVALTPGTRYVLQLNDEKDDSGFRSAAGDKLAPRAWTFKVR